MFRTLQTCFIASIASAAAADVVVFHNDNPDLDELRYSLVQFGYFQEPQTVDVLDITKDASVQPFAEPAPSGSLGFSGFTPGTSSSDHEMFTHTLGTDRIVVTDEPVSYFSPSFQQMIAGIAPRSFSQGGTINASSNWASSYFIQYGVHTFGPCCYSFQLEERFTLALRFQIAGATHYGFAEFKRFFVDGDSRVKLLPVRWGYETEPETALVIPASCLADVAMPFGELNFFDVADYIAAYNSQQSSADLAAPFGTINFFDIAEYLSLFNAGCP